MSDLSDDVRAELSRALGHLDVDRRDRVLEHISPSAFATADGEVDTGKVESWAADVAPRSGLDAGRKAYRDRKQGPGPGAGPDSSGVAAGRARYRQRKAVSGDIRGAADRRRNNQAS